MNITVITPVYNAEKYVRKAVESALQFEEVKEVILVEDGSPDKALAICKALVQEDKRVKLFQHENGQNHGAGASRNLGLKNATQEFIAFLDADDYFLPNRFDADKEIFQNNPKAEGCYGAIGVDYYNDDGTNSFTPNFASDLTTVQNKVESSELFAMLIGYQKSQGHFSIDGLTIKRSVLEKMKTYFNESLPLHQDTDFIFRIAYYSELISGNIESAVAMRGAHGENRITAVRKDPVKTAENQVKLWSSLYDWSTKEKIELRYQKFFKHQLAVWKLKQKSSLSAFFHFHYLVFSKPDLWKKHKFYNAIHKHIFGRNKLSDFLIKAKHKTQQFIRISGNLE